ncbi:MAG: hypothetical protein WDN09_02990 [bacterium]
MINKVIDQRPKDLVDIKTYLPLLSEEQRGRFDRYYERFNLFLSTPSGKALSTIEDLVNYLPSPEDIQKITNKEVLLAAQALEKRIDTVLSEIIQDAKIDEIPKKILSSKVFKILGQEISHLIISSYQDGMHSVADLRNLILSSLKEDQIDILLSDWTKDALHNSLNNIEIWEARKNS